MAPRLADDASAAEDMDFVTVHPSSLDVQWKSEYPSYDLATQVMYANCNIKAPACAEEQRKPVDVAVVLDRSGSMRGQKLDLCLKTVGFLIRELSPSDRLSIVTYDTSVRTDVPLTRMDRSGKASVEMALPKIKAGMATNLSGGLLQGLQEIQNVHRNDGGEPNAVKSILLLTDGLANHGITSTHELGRMVGGMLHEDVSLFTFGYGAGHNEELLRSLSDVGRGVYYFVENVDGVSLAFADCLGGLLSVVAQNIRLELSTTPGSEIISIKTKKEVKEIESKRRYEVAVGDMYGEEERDFVLVLRIRGMESGERASFSPLSCRITYANVLESTFANQDSSLIFERLRELPSGRTACSHVLRQHNRVSTAEAMEEATKFANEGNFAVAKSTLDEARQRVRDTMDHLSADDKAQTEVLLEELTEAHGSLASRSAYHQGGGSKRMSARSQMHYAQRNNDVAAPRAAMLSAAHAQPSAHVPGHSRASTYRSLGKMRMMKKAFDHSKLP